MEMTITLPTSLSEVSVAQHAAIIEKDYAAALGLTTEMVDLIARSGVDIEKKLSGLESNLPDVSGGFEFEGVKYSIARDGWCAEELLIQQDLMLSGADHAAIVAMYSRREGRGWDRQAFETSRETFKGLRADIAQAVCSYVIDGVIESLGTKVENHAY